MAVMAEHHHALSFTILGYVPYILIGGPVLFFVVNVLHQLFFHPLAKYPGPLLAKITNWRNVYHAWMQDQHLDLYELHEKYGTIVRFAPNAISVNDPYALQAIYGFKSNTRKSDFYTVFPAAPGVFSVHTAMDRAVHARKRRVASAAFSETALKNVEEYVLVHVREYLRRVAQPSVMHSSQLVPQKPGKSEWTPSFDIGEMNGYLTFDVMGDLCFGKSFGVLGDHPEHRKALFLVQQAFRIHNLNGAMPSLKHRGFDKYLFSKEFYNRLKYFAFSKKIMSERVSAGLLTPSPSSKPRKDFFYYLQNSKDPETGEGFPFNELWGESNTIIIAGSDTTSTTLTTALFYLLHNPKTLAHLTALTRQSFASLEDIVTGPKLNSQTYLRACIDETMRMTPVAGGLLPRLILEGGLDVLPGHHVPAGVIVGTPTYSLHHNAKFVQGDTFVFDPTRWLHANDPQMPIASGSSPDSFSKDQAIAALRSIFSPFSVGPRACIGRTMAYKELTITLARLLFAYDLRLPTSGNPEDRRIGMGGRGPWKGQTGRNREGEFQIWQDFVGVCEGVKVEARRREEVEV